jgi:uncharacterized membrane protein
MSDDYRSDFICPSCQLKKGKNEGRPLELISGPVTELINKKHPEWASQEYICLSCLNHYRSEYVGEILKDERGELTHLEGAVLESIREQEVIAKNVDAEFDSKFTIGEKIADRVAVFGGSWRFIILFSIVIFIWIVINTSVLLTRPYDPYPFILLNLILSCLAALQAPVIMMSQNRQEAKDRLRAEHDYQVNLKAELEIRNISAKIDQLISHQWQRLLEIQRIQLEFMEDIDRRNDSEKKND